VNRPADPVELLHAAIRERIDPLGALARFRVAQERFHEEYARANPVSCARGCSACCSQMVFDVAPVEVEDLGLHLRHTGRDQEVLDRLRERRDRFDAIRLEHPRQPDEEFTDWVDRLALLFWAEGIPCAFLDGDGACSVHAHRPQSCRRFFVHGRAELCAPESAALPAREARMVEPGLEDEVDHLLRFLGMRVDFDPEDDRLDHAMVRWLENRSRR